MDVSKIKSRNAREVCNMIRVDYYLSVRRTQFFTDIRYANEFALFAIRCGASNVCIAF